MNEDQELTQEEMDEIQREAQIKEIHEGFDRRMKEIEDDGYEERGDGTECPAGNDEHHFTLWHNDRTGHTISICQRDEIIEE